MKKFYKKEKGPSEPARSNRQKKKYLYYSIKQVRDLVKGGGW